MKLMLVTDMHGESPVPTIRKEIKESRIEKVIFLGDYDTPQVLEELRRLRIKKDFCVGNHDYHYMFCYGLSSKLMTMNPEDYAWLWKQYPEQRAFILRAIERTTKNSGIVIEENIDGLKIAYAHASLLDGNKTSSDVKEAIWRRLAKDSQGLIENFTIMQKRGYNVFFRGHDHINLAISFLKRKGKLEALVHSGEKFKLQTKGRHIVSVSAFYYGDYALFDTQTRILEYRNTQTGNRIKGI